MTSFASNSNNILQPSAIGQNCGNQEMTTQLCEALLHTTNNNNDARMNAENYMK
jgi:hypothetical protein